MASSTPSSGSIFGTPASSSSSTQSLQPPATQSVFGTTVTSTQPGQTIFGQPTPTPAASASPFGQPASSSSSSSTEAAATSNPFAKPSTDSGSVGVAVGMFGKKIEDQLDSSIYSLLESLSTQDLDSFKAPTFEIGKIPEIPPPRELCVA